MIEEQEKIKATYLEKRAYLLEILANEIKVVKST